MPIAANAAPMSPSAPGPAPGGALGLAWQEGGFWAAPAAEEVSYPEGANDLCHGIEEGSFWFRHRNRVILDAVRRFPPGGTLFDVGGGNGFVARALEEAGFPTALVEPGPAGVANAVARGLPTVVRATLAEAGFAAGSLPAVGLFDVVEHIADDAGFMAEVVRLLRPGGRAYLTVPAFRWLWSAEDDDAGHHRRYTPAALRRLLAGAGLEVEAATCFFWFLPLPVFLLRSLPSRLGLRGRPTAASARREHVAGGLASRLVDAALRPERAWLARGRGLPLGGSVLAVARRGKEEG